MNLDGETPLKVVATELQENLASNIFRFIDDFIVINDGNKFENHFKEIYPLKLILKRKNTSHRETTLQDLHFCINEAQIKAFVYDKRNFYKFQRCENSV